MGSGLERSDDSNASNDQGDSTPTTAKMGRFGEGDGNGSPTDDGTRKSHPSKDDLQKDGKPPRLASSDVHTGYTPPAHGHDGAASAWSTSSDKQLGFNSPNAHQDRVFPIRSVVSVDSSQTPYVGIPGRNSGEHGDYFPSMGVPPGAAGNEIAGNASNRRRRSQSTTGSDKYPQPATRRQSREVRQPEKEEPPKSARKLSITAARRP